MQKQEQGMDEASFVEWFHEDSFVSPEKAALAWKIAGREKRILERLDYRDGYSLYVGIPFCPTRCAYCSFVSADVGRALKLIDPFLDALCRELAATGTMLADAGLRVRTVYFGGGTPSLCAPEAVAGLLDHAATLFDCTAAEETTLEANPDDLTPAYLAVLRRAGVNRLSVGIQSFDDACLKLMNRRHNAAQAVEAVRSAQHEGYENITVDLIFGVPGFGNDTLRRSLDSALALGVQHISAYHLTVEPGTAFGRRAARGQFAPVDEATSETEYALVHETLTGAGFEHYEVSNFALPGFRARHNAAYWHGVKYLGIGPAAHSFDGRERHWNVASVTEYIGGAPAEAETLTDRDRFNEYVMTRLRTAEGIDLREAERLFGKERAARVLRDAEPWLKSRTLVLAAGRMAVPPARMLVSDAVIETFFETEPDTATK
jgi:oxygen-independent coproporphyrinogen-3 oxidase